MLPAGQIILDGVKMNAVSIGTPIDQGSNVIVVKTSGGRVRVRLATEDEVAGNMDFSLGDSGTVDARGTANPSSQGEHEKKLSDENTAEKESSTTQASGKKSGGVLESFDIDSLE